jgi:hypothetical protein
MSMEGVGRKVLDLLTNMHIYADKYTYIHALNVLLLLRMKMARAFSMQGRRRPRRRQDDGHAGRAGRVRTSGMTSYTAQYNATRKLGARARRLGHS